MQPLTVIIGTLLVYLVVKGRIPYYASLLRKGDAANADSVS